MQGAKRWNGKRKRTQLRKEVSDEKLAPMDTQDALNPKP